MAEDGRDTAGATGQQPAPDGERRRTWPTVLGVLVVLGLGGGAGTFMVLHSKPVSNPSSSASSAPATPTPHDKPTGTAGPTPTGAPALDLRTLLLSVPSAASPTPVAGAPDGTLNLDQVVKAAEGTPDFRSQLQSLGFQNAAESQWVEADRTWVGVILYRFADPTAAASYASSLQQGFHENTSFGPGVPIPGTLDGLVFACTSAGDNGQWFTEAVFNKESIAVELFVTGAVQHDPGKTVDLAAAQYARLP